MVKNLLKSNNKCLCLSRILFQEGANSRALGVFLKALVQAVFIFGLDTGLVTPALEGNGGVHHMVELNMMGSKPCIQTYGR